MQMSANGTIVRVCCTRVGVVNAGHVRTGQQATPRNGESAEK